jgi:hypothetical protein
VTETLQAPAAVFGRAKFRLEGKDDPTRARALDVNVYGLEFCDLTVERGFDGATPLLLVAGNLRNIARESKFIPPVRCSLRDTRSAEIFQLVLRLPINSLAPGESTEFRVQITTPPDDAVELEITFANLSDLASAGSK